ncbi:MAG: molybdopterin-dependent oxidoreductase [Actinomycetota bacterium]|nr:molybdopterin-dependent oxidoreductase [Actinomycetota bacterium]
MKISKHTGILTGALAGAMNTAAMIACLYAGWKAAGLPFVPFDAFDWITRLLPEKVIDTGIDSMVAVIRTFHLGPTASAAKSIERMMGVFGLFASGAILGAAFFGALDLINGRYAKILGLVLGGAGGVFSALISLHRSGTSTAPPAARALWILAVFLIWGLALALVYRKLRGYFITAAAREKHVAGVERINRRRFMIRLAGATAMITVSGAVIGRLSEYIKGQQAFRAAQTPKKRWSYDHPLPNAGDPVKPAPGTRPEFTSLEDHYRIDIDAVPPEIDGKSWRLKIKGLVERPLEFTLDGIRGYEPMHQFVTLACISNPVGGDLTSTTRWTGVSLQRILPELKLLPSATHLKISSADGFWEVVSVARIMEDKRIMLAYNWDGVPLFHKHGYPLRLYVPDLYGMKQPKWIESIEATSQWEPGYWVVRGWDRIARMKATSVIDTVAVSNAYAGPAGQTLVPIGGIAHAGARGISKVELQIDNGPWLQARLRKPLSRTTWVIWRYDMPFEPGEHTFTVRCFEADGTPQITEINPPEPGGATGLYSKSKDFGRV